ncbi:hypothetical protein GIB67_032668 [Kingdonia uniflora]|uniref:Uncharacterized protein n=1 Tax=Kingdonia uniflora TaxID=39325 RepID=A0A7J7MVV0_9MAGN|nr:hypothetical protein GIB67_032668 [Kingdonia uniflora]
MLEDEKQGLHDKLLSDPIRLDFVLPESWVAWPDEKDLWVLMLDKSLLKDVRYTKCLPWVYIAAKIKSVTSLSNALSESKNSSLRYVPRSDSRYLSIMDLDECYVSSVKIAPWVYIADKIESDLVASIEHLRSKMGSGECEEVLKPVFVAQFGKVVFHGIPFSNFNTISKNSGVEAALSQVFDKDRPFDKDQYQIISCKYSVMGIDGKLELHKMEMNQVHYSVIDMSCLDKNLDLSPNHLVRGGETSAEAGINVFLSKFGENFAIYHFVVHSSSMHVLMNKHGLGSKGQGIQLQTNHFKVLPSEVDNYFYHYSTLASAAICGVIYSIIGGQPLLILGVAEPTVLMYTFMFNFAKDKQDLGEKHFLPWTGWAIKGVVDEFRIPQREDPNAAALSLSWRFGNGMFALVMSFGFLLTALKSHKARSWCYGTGWIQVSITDYGVPLMVLVWTAVSYIPVNEVPKGIPRHLFSPNPWSPGAYSNWTARSSLVEKSRQKPKESLSVLSDVSILHYVCKFNDDQMLKSCGIKTDSKFTQVKGRALSDPKLKVGNMEDFFPRNEWWNFSSKKLVEPTRVNDQYLINILLKINGNLGGLNSMLTTEHGLNIPMISKAPAMMLGMDVSHGSHGQADVPSISVPDLTAPKVEILVAWPPVALPSEFADDKRSVRYNIISGTSISCPHATDAAF